MTKKLMIFTLGILVVLFTVVGQVFNASYWVQTKFNMVSFHPIAAVIWLIGSVAYLLLVWYSLSGYKAIPFYVLGVINFIYCILCFAGVFGLI